MLFIFFFLSSQDEFKKEKGEGLTQILCGKEGAEADAGASVCSLLLAQSEVRPECLLMVLANSTGKGHFGGLGLTRAESMGFMLEDPGWNSYTSASETTGAGKKGLVEKAHWIKELLGQDGKIDQDELD